MMRMGYPPSSTTSVSNPTQSNPIKSGEALQQAQTKSERSKSISIQMVKSKKEKRARKSNLEPITMTTRARNVNTT